MKVVQSGSQYRIYSNDLKTYDQFPVGTYTIRFSDMAGFYLVPHDNLAVQEKIYGPHLKKAQKVMASFAEFKRSLGVILSGPKGMGKSFFARILANEVNKAGMPVIIVDTYYDGVSSFIESITQECAVLFDEFDKVFDSDDVNTMLSLFDGTGSGKKLYIVTCNQISKMNDYIVNRPGRFHYHFRFEYPSNNEIRTYMQDKLDPVYYGQINKVVEFANKVSLNYDCLRAIAFELNHGEDFADAIEDLNIINIDRQHFVSSLKCKCLRTRLCKRLFPVRAATFLSGASAAVNSLFAPHGLITPLSFHKPGPISWPCPFFWMHFNTSFLHISWLLHKSQLLRTNGFWLYGFRTNVRRLFSSYSPIAFDKLQKRFNFVRSHKNSPRSFTEL